VQNNPLSYTDPSGFFLKGLFRTIGNVLRAIGRAFVHAARAIARSTIGRAILQIVACATPGVNAFACAAVGAGLTLAAGGTLKQAFIGAAISFVQMGAYAGIHQAIGGIANATVAAVAKVGLHAVVGGAVSMAQGGSFETGALTGAVAAGSSLLMDSSGVMGHSGDGNPEYIAERTFNRRKRRYGSGARK